MWSQGDIRLVIIIGHYTYALEGIRYVTTYDHNIFFEILFCKCVVCVHAYMHACVCMCVCLCAYMGLEREGVGGCAYLSPHHAIT